MPAPLSYLHSTMGKLNINALINPLYPSPAATRTLPMQALFKNMVPDSQLVTLANHVVNHNLSGLDWGAPGQYDYIGELCEVAGVADTGTTNWQKEVIIRNLANVLTTQSNTFKVYGLAQVVNVQKKAGNTNYAAVEAGDTVTVNGEKRFESVIERSVWPGGRRGARQRACDKWYLRSDRAIVGGTTTSRVTLGWRPDSGYYVGSRDEVGAIRWAG